MLLCAYAQTSVLQVPLGAEDEDLSPTGTRTWILPVSPGLSLKMVDTQDDHFETLHRDAEDRTPGASHKASAIGLNRASCLFANPWGSLSMCITTEPTVPS